MSDSADVLETILHPIAKGQSLDGQYWAPLHYQRLLTSTWRTRAVRPENRDKAVFGFLLWFEALRQDPPGTLPQDDDELAQLAGFGMDVEGWMEVREFALYGWKPCHVSDVSGEILPVMRLQHDVVASVAVEAMKRKVGAAASRESGQRAVKKSRIKEQLRKLMPGGREPSNDAVEWITDWIVDGDLRATVANVKIGWDRFTGREGGTVKSM